MSDLELLNVCKSFAGSVVVNDFTLSVGEGELVSLLGPSGCGKSTTLRLIAGFIEPDSGQILIGGDSVSAGGQGVLIPPDKRGIGLVFQSYALWPHMKVSKNVAYGLKARKCPKQEVPGRVAKALSLVEMGSYADRYPSELSGGQQQRIALARALAYDPQILLLDEPLSNLDAQLRDQLRIQIRAVQQRLGVTAVYVTHDQREAMSMSDRIVVMNKGIVHQIADPETIFTNPATDFVANFIGSSNMIRGRALESALRDEIMSVEIGLPAPMKARAAVDLSAQSAVAICVRPESSVLAVEENTLLGDGQRLPVTIVSESYQGPTRDYIVDTSNGISLTVQSPKSVHLEVGSTAFIGLRPDNCIATVDSSAVISPSEPSENPDGEPAREQNRM